MGIYQYENLNPLKRKVSDCVIRAIAKAEGKTWLEVFDNLVSIARKEFCIPNESRAYDIYLSNYQTIPVMYFNEYQKKMRYTVADICTWKGTYVVSGANHVTCVIDGVIHDTWDTSKRSAYKIWKIC